MQAAVGHLLHAFYGASVNAEERENVHRQLLAALQTDDCVGAADEFVASTTAHVAAQVQKHGPGNMVSERAPLFDPLVMYYSLHALETRARSQFDNIPQQARLARQRRLIELTAVSFTWNNAISTAALSDASLAAAVIPPYVLSKVARAAVEYGKREWIKDQTAEFPRTVLALVDQNGHTASSIPRIFAGMLLLTTFVDDALDKSRTDMRARDLSLLPVRLASISDGVVAALEIGIRISGPGLPQQVPVAAARAVGSVTKLAPKVAPEAVAILRRCLGGRCDAIGVECLVVLHDLYGESKIPLPGPWQELLAHVTSVLDPLAVGECGIGDSDEEAAYRKHALGYAEAVIGKCVAHQCDGPPLERALNGLMGCTLRWAKQAPASLPGALEAWLSILERLEEAEAPLGALIETAYGAVARLCTERCMFATNGDVLHELDDDDDDDDVGKNTNGAAYGPRGDAESEDVLSDGFVDLLAELGSSPDALSSTMLFTAAQARESAQGGGREGESDDMVDRQRYRMACVDAAADIARLWPNSLCLQVVQCAHRVLSSRAAWDGAMSQEGAADLATAAAIAASAGPHLGGLAGPMSMLLETTAGLLTRVDTGKHSRVVYRLLRAACALAPALAREDWEQADAISQSLIHTARSIVSAELNGTSVPKDVQVAASALALTVYNVGRPGALRREAPIAPDVLRATPRLAVAALGIVGHTRWCLATPQRASARGARAAGPTPAEWAERAAALRDGVGAAFRAFLKLDLSDARNVTEATLVQLARDAVLLRSVVSCVFDESNAAKECAWRSVVRDSCVYAQTALEALAKVPIEQLGASSEHVARSVQRCMSVLLGSIGASLRVFRRQFAEEHTGFAERVLTTGVAYAQQRVSAGLARSLLVLLRDELGDGNARDKEGLVLPGVQLAVSSAAGGADADVATAALGVLVECLTRHWLFFWPGDVVKAEHGGSPVTVSASQAHGVDPARREAYTAALSRVVDLVGAHDAGVSGAAMLALESLNARRRLYMRADAFRALGAHDRVVHAVVAALAGPHGGLAEDGVAVLFGIASADWNGFFASRMLERAVCAAGLCTEPQASELAGSFGRPTDRPTFSRSARALLNDAAHYAALNRGPSL